LLHRMEYMRNVPGDRGKRAMRITHALFRIIRRKEVSELVGRTRPFIHKYISFIVHVVVGALNMWISVEMT